LTRAREVVGPSQGWLLGSRHVQVCRSGGELALPAHAYRVVEDGALEHLERWDHRPSPWAGSLQLEPDAEPDGL